MARQKYPVGVQTFEKLRQENYIYVDKTALVYELACQSVPIFLSRPRRFGKSLLLSTIDAYFSGRRELFKGLAIESLTDDWQPHPVFHLDLSGCAYLDKDSLGRHIDMYLARWEKIYGDENSGRDLSGRFASLLAAASEKTGKKAVVLIDEYDKPLLDTLDEDRREIHSYYKEVLRGFYGCLKSNDRYLRFVMLSGVTKFSQVSIFSGLNNLKDISMSRKYSTICGVTQEELERDLSEGIRELGEEYGMDREETISTLKERYVGYHFAADLRDVYNPFSLLNALDNCQLGNYWFQSGNPKFLAVRLKEDHIDLHALQKSVETGTRLQDLDLAMTNPVPLLFQTGYLTIKRYDRDFDEYSLGYPNREVKESFLRSLVPYYVEYDRGTSSFDVKRFVQEVRGGDVEAFMKRFQALFAGFPYDQVGDCELHYHNVIYLTFVLMGFYVRTEYRTSDGRCDAVVMTDTHIYIFEFKYNRSAEVAIRQIDEKGYALPFAADPRQLIKIGVNFSSKTRRIDDVKIVKG